MWASNLESLRSGSADPDSKPDLPASQSPRKRLTSPSAMQLDVNFQAQNNTLHANNGPDNYANSRHRSDSQKGFPGERASSGMRPTRLTDSRHSSRGSRNVASVPVHNVMRHRCLQKIAYTGHVYSINGAPLPVMGASNRLRTTIVADLVTTLSA